MSEKKEWEKIYEKKKRSRKSYKTQQNLRNNEDHKKRKHCQEKNSQYKREEKNC